MNKLAIIAAVGLSAATFGLAAVAQDGQSDFQKADANQDLGVSFEEAFGIYPTLVQAIYDQADANKDGTLDETEYLGLAALVTTGDDSSTPSSSEADPSSSSSTPS